MFAFPVDHSLITAERSPTAPGCCSTTNPYAMGGIRYWHRGGEGEGGVCFNAIEKLANLIVYKENRALPMTDIKR